MLTWVIFVNIVYVIGVFMGYKCKELEYEKNNYNNQLHSGVDSADSIKGESRNQLQLAISLAVSATER